MFSRISISRMYTVLLVVVLINGSAIGVTPAHAAIDATSFAAKVDFGTGTYPYSVAIGDLDGDGKPELAVANFSSNTVSVFRNTSASGTIDVASFTAKVDFGTGGSPYSVAIGDLDGDGKPELATANTSNSTVSVFRNTNTPPDTTAPTVQTITRANPSPTNATSVDFTVTFSESVTGVDTGDFALTTTGVTGASIIGVGGSGATYTVSVNTGSGTGTIRLDVTDDDSIVDGASNPLGGAGAGNGNFIGGETYTIDRTPPTNTPTFTPTPTDTSMPTSTLTATPTYTLCQPTLPHIHRPTHPHRRIP